MTEPVMRRLPCDNCEGTGMAEIGRTPVFVNGAHPAPFLQAHSPIIGPCPVCRGTGMVWTR